MAISLDQRRQQYFDLNSRLSQLDDDQLRELVGRGKVGDGASSKAVRLGRQKLFVKRVPIADVERERPFSTANMFRLPLYFNYGVGSAGLGVWREIVTHIKTTNWVLSGAHEGFPLLYHWRLLRRSADEELDEEWLKGFVRYWNSSQRIEQFVRARAAGQYEAVLVLEYVPHALWGWLDKHFDQLDSVIAQMQQTLAFLRRQGVIHFDCHYGNILTDGERTYLTDFGLVLDRSFHLQPRERAFFARHRYYDCGEFLSCLADLLQLKFRRLSERTQQRLLDQWGLKEEIRRQHPRILLGEHIDRIVASDLLPLDPRYVEAVERYYPVIRLMQDFFSALGRSNRKDATLSQAVLRRRLQQTGFLT